MSDTKPLASLSSGLLARKGTATPAMRRQGLSGLIPASDKDTSSMQEDLGWNDMGYDVDPKPEENEDEKPANPLMAAVPEVVRQRDDLAERLKASDSAASERSREDGANPAQPADSVQKDTREFDGEDEADEAPVRGDFIKSLQQDGAAYDYEDNEDDETGLGSFAEEQHPDSSTGAPINVANSPLSTKKSASPQVNWTEAQPEENAGQSAQREMPNIANIAAHKKPVAMSVPSRTIAAQPAKLGANAGRRAAFTLRVDPERHLQLRLACALQNVSAQQFVTRALDEYLAGIPELTELSAKLPSTGSLTRNTSNGRGN